MRLINLYSNVELQYACQLDYISAKYIEQYKAIPDRKYKFDFFLPESNLLVEIQGGTFQKKRTAHSTGTGIRRDCFKTVLAQICGFNIFNFTTDMVKDGTALKLTEAFIFKKQINFKEYS